MRRDEYLLLGAFFVSTVGDWLYRLALPLIVFEITHSAFDMALVYALEFAPYLLFSLAGGVLADRVDRRRLLIAGDLVSAGLVAAVAVVVWLRVPEPSLLYAGAFLVAGVAPFYHPAFHSMLPTLVEPDRLAAANARLHGTDTLVSLLGPVIGGGVILSLGPARALVFNAASFAASAVAIAVIRRRAAHQPPREDRSVLHSVREGVSYVRANRLLLSGSVLFAGTNLAIHLLQANFVYFLAQVRDFTPLQIGLVFAGQGLGAVVGASMAPRLGRRFESGRLIITSTIVAGLMTFLLVPARSVLALSAVSAAVAATGMTNVVTWFTLRQRIVPGHLLGRVVALTRMLAFSSIPLAAVLGGALLRLAGSVDVVIILSAGLRALVGLGGCLTAMARSVREAEDPPRADAGRATRRRLRSRPAEGVAD